MPGDHVDHTAERRRVPAARPVVSAAEAEAVTFGRAVSAVAMAIPSGTAARRRERW
ncbi:hypothetical protein WBG99_28360 [Streptomyces sp. TG1A-60]|uniref:hypothetical protein n=1 Tax=Streptomyces sp. TG1A-60 TaxID=3129111 RepID=UPI0030CD116C